MESLLEFHNLSKQFGGIHVLKNVGFSIAKGEVHALVGENGAGKSTLIKIATGVYTPDQAGLRYQGEDARWSSPVDSRRRGIAVIHQES
ncbi:MAG: ATP-binding cassette domain-containing protein, partial [Candidatus Omnitrophica bacterium]|nr:ATP-binding cassette domain-containing protein [Candidatus Omnitrophota bacterium]